MRGETGVAGEKPLDKDALNSEKDNDHIVLGNTLGNDLSFAKMTKNKQ